MLQSIRDNLKGAVAIFIVGMISIPFVLFGVDSLFLHDSSAGKAAEVNGEAISEVNLLRAIRTQKQQLLERFGEQAPAELVSDERLRGPVLERMIERELLRQAAVNGGMTVPSGALDALIISTEQFQQEGKFSPELYTQLLRAMGYTPVEYKALLLEDAVVSQLATGITTSSAASMADFDQLVQLTQQGRSFSYLTLPYDEAAKNITLEDQELQDYYNANQKQFMAPEMASVELIELSLDQLAEKVVIDDSAVRAQFEAELKGFVPRTERHVAHILIESGDESDAKIAAVQEKLAAGEPFETLAKEFSDDLGSSESGGDLGVTDGGTFPEAFEQAAAELSPGQVSEPVVTEAGTHFIKLISVETTTPPGFDESRERLRETLAYAEAESQFAELLNELPDAAYNSVSLEDVAESLGLDVVVSELFDRKGGPGVLSNNQVLAAVFSDEVLHEGQASEVIEVSDNHIVVVKLKEHREAAVKSFASVADDIRESLTREKAIAVLLEQANTLNESLLAGSSIEAVATQNQLRWENKDSVVRNSGDVLPELLNHVFRLPKPDAKPVISTLTTDAGDVLVVQLTSAKPGALPDLEAAQKMTLRQRLAREFGAMDLLLYQNAIATAAKTEIY